MISKRIRHTVVGAAAAGLLLGSFPAVAAPTICTELIRGPDGSIPVDERESARQVQARIKPGLIAEGDKLAGDGKLAEAVETYSGIFGGYWYAGFYSSAMRCLPVDFYQGAASKLRAVASELAERRRARGHLLDESHEYGGDLDHGALRLYLLSNQYDRFISEAFAYADTEFLERDIDDQLMAMVSGRLGELETYRNAGSGHAAVGYTNDLTPLLDEELAAFTKLAGFDEKLKARFASRYPDITEHWLAEEARHFGGPDRTDEVFAKEMFLERAKDALKAGADRLREHPRQVARLKARANTRGEALMRKGSEVAGGEGLMGLMATDYYAHARDYFEFAGNQEQAAVAGRLSDERQESVEQEADRIEASIRTDVEKMRKSDEEQASFQEATDEMAREFGFDLDE